MTCSTFDTAAQETLVIVRYWWLKRLTVVVVTGLVILVLSRIWWGYEADRRLAAVIADAKAHGEPILAEDFAGPNIPDSANAAILFNQAASQIVTTRQYDRLNLPNEFERMSPGDLTVIRDTVAVNAHVLSLVREASTRPSDSWKFLESSPPVRGWRLNKGTLGKLLQRAAAFHHQSGDDTKALCLTQDLLRLADSMDSGPGDFIDHLVSLSLQSEATDAVGRITTDPQLDISTVSVEVRKHITDLIALLLRDDHYRHADVRAMYSLRKAYVEMRTEFDSTSDLQDRILSPMYKLDLARWAGRYAIVARALEAPNEPTALAQFPQTESFEGSHLYQSTRLFSNQSDGPSIWGAIRGMYPTILRRRVAAIRLGILLYRSDHLKSYPATLDDLVPAYLPSIPRDVAAEDGRPLAYRPTGHPPIIYNIDYRESKHVFWDGSDNVFPLEPPPKKAPPASRKAEQHQPDQHDRLDQSVAKHK